MRDALVDLKVHMTRNFFIILFERAFKMMKNDVYFNVIAFLVCRVIPQCDVTSHLICITQNLE